MLALNARHPAEVSTAGGGEATQLQEEHVQEGVWREEKENEKEEEGEEEEGATAESRRAAAVTLYARTPALANAEAVARAVRRSTRPQAS